MRVDDFHTAFRITRARLVRRLRPSPILLACAAVTAAVIGGAAPAAAQTHTIEVQASGGGTVTPDGLPDGFVTVPAGGTQIFQFAPSSCFRVADVQVDNVSVGAVTSYTFTNVQSDHILYVEFGPASYSITATAGPGGSISPSGTVPVTCGGSA